MSIGAAAGSWKVVDGDVVRVGSAAGRVAAVIGTRCRAAGIRPGGAGISGAHSGRGCTHASMRGMAAIVIGIGGFVVFGESLVMLL
jgi:hypothetical protein